MKKILRLFNLAKRFKLRHLRLGGGHLFRLSRYHIREVIGVTHSLGPSVKASDWILRKSSITILMTVFNQSEEELRASLDSARAQKGAIVEIIIFDDGSTRTETIKFLESIVLSSNERLIRSSNIGVVAARNQLIEIVETDFLLFLDPDDVLDPFFVSKSFEILELDRSVEIVFPNVLIHDIALNNYQIWETGPFDADVLSNQNTLPMSSIISTRLIRLLDGYSSDFENGPEDWDLWFRASLSGARARHINTIGYKYTKAENSRSSRSTDHSDLIGLRKIGKRAQFPFSAVNKIEIFLIIPWLPRIGGVEKYVKCLLEDLEEYGFRVAVVVTELDPDGYEDDAINFRNLGNLVIKRQEFISDELFLYALRNLSTETSIGVNFGSAWAFENTSALSSIFHKNVCFIFNNEISLQRAVIHRESFDEFWVAYEKILEHIPDSMAIKSLTIYTGVVNQQERPLREKYGEKFIVGFLGRLSPEKNPDGFLEIARLAETIDGISFTIAGEGPLQSKVIKKARNLRNVDFLGFVSDNAKFFSNIDCLIISSKVEGIPLSAMEALSFGVPIIATPVGGIPELITSNDQGFLWPGSPDEALHLIAKLKDRSINGGTSGYLAAKFWRRNTSSQVINRILQLQK